MKSKEEISAYQKEWRKRNKEFLDNHRKEMKMMLLNGIEPQCKFGGKE